MKRSTIERLQRNTILFTVTLAVLACAGLILSTKYSLKPNYTVPICQALLGSAVAGLLIDITARHRFLKEIGREVFGYIIGQHYPKEAREFINQFINTKIILSHHVRVYSFEIVTNNQVKIEVRADYQVRNYSVSTLSYSPILHVEEENHPEIIQLTCGFPSDEQYSVTGTELMPKSDRDRVKIFEGREVKLKPVSADFDQPYRVTWIYTIIKPITSEDMISFGRTTIGVEIQARYDSKKLKVEIDKGEYGVNKIDEYTWRAPDDQSLFVERQHIEIKWKPIYSGFQTNEKM